MPLVQVPPCPGALEVSARHAPRLCLGLLELVARLALRLCLALVHLEKGSRALGAVLEACLGDPELGASLGRLHCRAGFLDLGLGGTNLRGFTVGFQYGVYRNTTVGVRYMSAQNIDTTINSNFPTASYKVNSLQVDFNVRF